MTTRKPLAEGDDIAWTDIHPDGTEEERYGVVWALAVPLAGMSAWWVQPDGCAGPTILVARSSRRHRCGRARASGTVLGMTSSAGVWLASGGRYVDTGEYFRETDLRSRFARSVRQPTHAVVQRMDSVGEVAMRQYVALCDAAADGRNVDMSVSAVDVADEVERVRSE